MEYASVDPEAGDRRLVGAPRLRTSTVPSLRSGAVSRRSELVIDILLTSLILWHRRPFSHRLIKATSNFLRRMLEHLVSRAGCSPGLRDGSRFRLRQSAQVASGLSTMATAPVTAMLAGNKRCAGLAATARRTHFGVRSASGTLCARHQSLHSTTSTPSRAAQPSIVSRSARGAATTRTPSRSSSIGTPMCDGRSPPSSVHW